MIRFRFQPYFLINIAYQITSILNNVLAKDHQTEETYAGEHENCDDCGNTENFEAIFVSFNFKRTIYWEKIWSKCKTKDHER